MQKIIIIDLQGQSSVVKVNETGEYYEKKARIVAQQALSKAIPRDRLVWTKTEGERAQVSKAKRLWKSYIRLMYPGVTNKSGFYSQKALIWS